jgi:hypothetical protein
MLHTRYIGVVSVFSQYMVYNCVYYCDTYLLLSALYHLHLNCIVSHQPKHLYSDG